MRFDDRLATALGQMAETPAARQAVWRQLVDLLGHAAPENGALRADAMARLRAWRAEVPPSSRQSAAVMLTGQDVPVDLVAFFAEDLTAVAAPLLATVQLTAEQWVDLIPGVSPIARALLRHRRDLPLEARRLLEAYGPTDMVISAPIVANDSERPEVAAAQDIEGLRARIDALRAARVQNETQAARAAPASFDFETDQDGIIRWCDLANRGCVVGLSIAEPAGAGQQGVDGHTAGAFRDRTAFRNARLSVAQGPAAGAWSLSGVPGFDPATGRFLGYRGNARRPRAGERADQPHLLGLSVSGDSARQFAHEMRTPLNAIAGFAEMIQRQMLGPASAAYRDHAAGIMTEAKRIGAVLDELEEAARLDGADVAPPAQEVDCAQLLARVTSALEPIAADRGVLVTLVIAPRCAPALVNFGLAERLVTRLLSSCLSVAAAGERLAVEVSPGQGLRDETVIAVSRPACLSGMDEAALYDACDVDGAIDEPPLGLGFSLRFLRRSAEACGGRFQAEGQALRLGFPSVVTATPSATDQATTDWADWLRRERSGAACQGESGSAIAPDPVGPVAQW